MNAEDILSDVQLIDLTNRDAQFVRAELIDKIDSAIAAAVQAERDKIAKALPLTINTAIETEREACAELAKSMIGATRHEIAAAIRARNGRK